MSSVGLLQLSLAVPSKERCCYSVSHICSPCGSLLCNPAATQRDLVQGTGRPAMRVHLGLNLPEVWCQCLVPFCSYSVKPISVTYLSHLNNPSLLPMHSGCARSLLPTHAWAACSYKYYLYLKPAVLRPLAAPTGSFQRF